MKVGIIGYGSMGKMLLWKFSEKGSVAKQDLYVTNRTIEKCEEAANIAQIVPAKELAANCDFVFVCVRPADIKTVLEDIKDSVKENALIVSLNGKGHPEPDRRDRPLADTHVLQRQGHRCRQDITRGPALFHR